MTDFQIAGYWTGQIWSTIINQFGWRPSNETPLKDFTALHYPQARFLANWQDRGDWVPFTAALHWYLMKMV